MVLFGFVCVFLFVEITVDLMKMMMLICVMISASSQQRSENLHDGNVSLLFGDSVSMEDSVGGSLGK